MVMPCSRSAARPSVRLAKSGGIYANLLKLQRTAGVGIDDELARYDIAAERKH